MSQRFVITVCRVELPEGSKDYVTCVPQELVFASGLLPEWIVGELLRPPTAGEPMSPEHFARNRIFVDFLHEVIARRAPKLPNFIAEARRQQDGLIVLIDQRTPTPEGPVPPEDILGVFKIQGGQVRPNSYQPSPNHAIWSANGFFRLNEELETCLMEELLALQK